MRRRGGGEQPRPRPGLLRPLPRRFLSSVSYLLVARGEVKVQGSMRCVAMAIGLLMLAVARGAVGQAPATTQTQPAEQAPGTGQAQPAGQQPVAVAPDAASGPAGVVAAPGAADGGTIKGTVKAGAVPLPGVGVTAANSLTGKKYATTTDVTGAFAMAVPRNGRYVVRAELAAFAPETKEVVINAAGANGGKPEQVAEFGMQLASRVAQEEERQTAVARVGAGGAGAARGLQSLSVTGDGE